LDNIRMQCNTVSWTRINSLICISGTDNRITIIIDTNPIK
jgi:hypothetical protein